MGAYLNKPVTQKISEEGEGAGLKYGATSMQGWRVNQEDAHNCNIDLADGWSLFAVYDGHGGSEVSKYTADNFPEFLKNREFWNEEDITKALEKIFIDFDDNIRSENVMKELQKMANAGKEKPQRVREDSDDENDRIKTIEEARLPLEQILARYGYAIRAGPDPKSLLNALVQDEGDEDSGREKKKRHSKSPSQAQPKRAKTETDIDDPEDPKPTSKESDGKDESENSEPIPDAESTVSKDAPDEPQPSAVKTKTAKSNNSVEIGDELEATEDDSDEEDADFSADGTDDESEDEEDEDEEEGENDDDEDEIFLPGAGDVPGEDSGTTACVCLIGKNKIVVANAGDSRAVLSRGGTAINLSEDHKPEDEKERTRIEKAGGSVNGDGRVNGGLNLSRALGDHCYKKNAELKLEEQMISALPDVKIEELRPEDEFVVVACDGIWNSLESQEVVNFVKEGFGAGKNCQKIAEELCDKCLAETTAGDGTGCDNMTVIITQIMKNE